MELVKIDLKKYGTKVVNGVYIKYCLIHIDHGISILKKITRFIESLLNSIKITIFF